MSQGDGHPKPVATIRRGAIAGRRRGALTVTALLVTAVVVVCGWMESRLVHAAWISGHVLAVLVVFLAAFGLRKRFPSVGWMGTASTWMQWHAWSGIGALVIFGLHIGWRIPTGWFEQVLAVVFLMTGGSGILGLIATRLIPRRLSSIPRQVFYEQIPLLRQELALRANALVAECPGTTLARHYVNHVAAFLHLPRPVLFAVAPSARSCKRLIADLRGLDRYLSAGERETSRGLMQIIREKDDLDYHRAMQGRLKWWVVGHIALTAVLVLLTLLHTGLVYTFDGSGQ